ncbi:MAG: hypothetical protein AB1486_17930 [Planctomycetota bacterium]
MHAILALALLAGLSPIPHASPHELDGDELVGKWGDAALLTFEGAESYPSDTLRDGLTSHPDFLMLSHPASRLPKYLDGLREMIVAGYRRGGFPHVSADVSLDRESRRLLAVIREGTRYVCGPVVVHGAHIVPPGELVARLTQPREPTVVEQAMGARGSDQMRKVLWPPGQLARLDEGSRQHLEQTIRLGLCEWGLFFPRVRVEYAVDEPERSVSLVIHIEDEGPTGVANEIEITGNNKNSREELLNYLEITPGMRLDRETIARLDDRLRQSARFLQHDVHVEPPRTEGGATRLRLELREYEPAPPLAAALSASQQIMLRLGEWLAGLNASDADLVFEFEVPRTSRASLLFSPNRGILGEVEASLPGVGTRIHYIVDVTSESLSVHSLERGESLSICGVQIHPWVRIHAYPAPAPSDRPFIMDFAWGLSGSPSGDSTSRCELFADLCPAALLELEQKLGDGAWNLQEDIATATAEGVLLRIDRQRGAFLEVQVGSPDAKLSLRCQKGAREAALKDVVERTGFANSFDRAHPVSSVGTFVAEELAYHAGGIVATFGGEKGIKAASALAKIATHLVLESLDCLWAAEPPPGDARFVVPRGAARASESSVAEMIAYAGTLVRKLVPYGSWAHTLARDTTLLMSGENQFYGAEVRRFSDSETMGPLGFLTAAWLVGLVDERAARTFARKGLDHLSATEFVQDCQALLAEGGALRGVALGVVQAVGALEASEVEALAAVFGEPHADRVTQCLDALRESSAQPPDERLYHALLILWNGGLAEAVRTTLERLASRS